MVYTILRIVKDGTKQICLYVDNRSPYKDRRADIREIDECIPWSWEWGRHNVTVVALNRSVTVYLDGLVVYHLQLKGGEGEWPRGYRFVKDAWRHKIDIDAEPWIYVGPSAYYALQFYAWPYPGIGVPLKPLGNATLLVGNGTLSLPPYLYVVGARASDFDGFWLRALPPPYVPNADRQYRFEEVYLETPRYTVYFNETPAKLLKGTLLRLGRCNLTEGGLVPASRLGLNVSALAVVGEGRVYCPRYKVTVRLPNGTVVELWARPGEAVAYDPPPVVDLGNGTRLVDPQPVRVRVNYSDASVEARYGAREYLIRFTTPLGVVETWAREGAVATHPGADVDLGNGTRVVVHPASVTAQRPTTASPSYEVYYRVTVVTPFNETKTWAKRGTSFEYGLPQFVDLGNGTALRSPNGTCAFYVDGPKTCAIAYRERLYWVSVRTPFNETVGWALEGSVVRLPEVFDLNNDTRWVGPGFYAVVDKPIDAAPAYRRQYYIEVMGITEWRGWADEGSQIRLNETVVNGVRYVPQTPFIEVRGPASVKPRYAAYYYTQFSDVLGLPNPWASVELCGQRFRADEAGRVYARADTDSPCEVRAEAPPLGPYSLAIISAVAAVAAAVAVRQLRKK